MYEPFYSGTWSLLTCSAWFEAYTKGMMRMHQENLKGALLIHKNGVSSCHLVSNQRKVCAEQMIKKYATMDGDFDRYDKIMREQHNRIETMIKQKEPLPSFLQAFSDYISWYTVMRAVTDFAPKERIDQLFEKLRDLRILNEDLPVIGDYYVREQLKNLKHIKSHLSPYLLFNEIAAVSNGAAVDETILQNRAQKAVLYAAKKSVLYINEQADEYEKRITEQNQVDELKGTCAHPGQAMGNARIVKDPKKCTDFQEGEILITPMTRPDFLHLMNKAGAIVTDIGGLLCHAAIVAREIGKPCLIGTKSATTVFKEGEKIEVDALKGTVRRLV